MKAWKAKGQYGSAIVRWFRQASTWNGQVAATWFVPRSSSGCWQIVCSCGWVTSIFCRPLCFGLTYHKAAAARQPRAKAAISRLECKSWERRREETDGDEIVKLSGKALYNFLSVLLLFSKHRRQLSSLLGLQEAVAAVTILIEQIIKCLWPSSSSGTVIFFTEGYPSQTWQRDCNMRQKVRYLLMLCQRLL